jgi:hypothetical protein
MICPWAGGAVRYRPVKKGPMTVPGIVLFWGAAIPGDIPHIGKVGDQSGVAEPQTLRTERLEGAQRERIWASTKAHESGLSATGLNSSRDSTPGLGRGPRDPPVAQSAAGPRTDHPCPEAAPAAPTFRPAGSPHSWCREWLERLDRGELVVVNLRPETDPPAKAVERPGRTGGLMDRSGPATSRAKVSPTLRKSESGPSHLGAVSEKVR